MHNETIAEKFNHALKLSQQVVMYKQKRRGDVIQKIILCVLIVTLLFAIFTGVDDYVKSELGKLFTGVKVLVR